MTCNEVDALLRKFEKKPSDLSENLMEFPFHQSFKVWPTFFVPQWCHRDLSSNPCSVRNFKMNKKDKKYENLESFFLSIFRTCKFWSMFCFQMINMHGLLCSFIFRGCASKVKFGSSSKDLIFFNNNKLKFFRKFFGNAWARTLDVLIIGTNDGTELTYRDSRPIL